MSAKRGQAMVTLLKQMTEDYFSSRDMIAKLTEEAAGATSNHHEALMEPLLERMAVLAQRIGSVHACTPEELAMKARVALDCINEDGDTSDAVSASLCRDLLSFLAREKASAPPIVEELPPRPRLAAVGR